MEHIKDRLRRLKFITKYKYTFQWHVMPPKGYHATTSHKRSSVNHTSAIRADALRMITLSINDYSHQSQDLVR
ncbi:hypothetical protein E1A91_A05G002100v1 [Gossypium mustelinum]|uniref:Uncharacterized protein n=1 Tax=Gossypium mustelinum TaxID=34275 RepID=A0A5D2Z1P7_GOSMU|nr:hypothetical protein E1A91_A05G002100v1 [Gossypium mustelinum]